MRNHVVLYHDGESSIVQRNDEILRIGGEAAKILRTRVPAGDGTATSGIPLSEEEWEEFKNVAEAVNNDAKE